MKKRHRKTKRTNDRIFLGEETCDAMIMILVDAVVEDWDAKALGLLYDCFPGAAWADLCAHATVSVWSHAPLALPWRG
jgi:hypothetical protein